jgi:hypothetical protein
MAGGVVVDGGVLPGWVVGGDGWVVVVVGGGSWRFVVVGGVVVVVGCRVVVVGVTSVVVGGVTGVSVGGTGWVGQHHSHGHLGGRKPTVADAVAVPRRPLTWIVSRGW